MEFPDLKIKLLQFETITADGLGIDFLKFDEFITPESDLYMLVLVSKAQKRGLNLENINTERFLSSCSEDLLINVMDSGPFPGANYIEISLDHLLKAGKTFTYKGHSEVFGADFMMNTLNLILELEMDLEKEHNVTFSDSKTFIKTPYDLLRHLNIDHLPNEQTMKNWWRFWK